MADNTVHIIKARIKSRITKETATLETRGVQPEVFEEMIYAAFALNPALADCTPDSVDKALIDCIYSGCAPDGKEAHIVPRGGQAKFEFMILGRLKLAHRASPGLTLRTRAVYRDDEWEYAEGLYPVLKHTPKPNASRADDDLIATYAVAHLPNAYSQSIYAVALRPEIDRARGWSQARKGGPWFSHFQEMAQNVVLKRLLKLLPQPMGFSWGSGQDEDDVPDAEMDGVGNVPPPTPASVSAPEPEPEPEPTPPEAPAAPEPAGDSPF